MTEYEAAADLSQLSKEISGEDNEAIPGLEAIRLLTQLAGHKRLIAIVTGSTAIAGIVTSLLLPTRFTAVTQIMTPQQTPSTAAVLMNQLTTSGAGSLAAASGGLGLKSPNDLYIGLLQSRPVADALIENFDLMKVYNVRERTTARKKLALNTSILSEKSGLLSVAVVDQDKKRAADMANQYTYQLRLLTKGLAITEASQRRVFYEEQLVHAKADLLNAERVFEEVQRQKGLVQPDAQAKALIGGVAELRAQIAAKEVELDTLKSYSTDRNPDVQIAKSESASLRQQLTQLESRSGGTASADFDLKELARSGVDYLRAEHELQYRQTLFDLILKQYDAARLDESKNAAVIQVVEPAIPPDVKSSPKRALIIFYFVSAGFAGACLWIVAGELVGRSPAGAEALAKLKGAILSR